MELNLLCNVALRPSSPVQGDKLPCYAPIKGLHKSGGVWPAARHWADPELQKLRPQFHQEANDVKMR